MDKWEINSDRMVKAAREYLNRDLSINADMLQNMDLGRSKILKATESGVLIQDRFSGTYMISASSEEAQKLLLDEVEEAEVLTVHGDYCFSHILEKYKNIVKADKYVEAVYMKKEPLDLPELPEIRQLNESYSETVFQQYSHMSNRDYIVSRICDGAIYGAFVDGQLAGFIGTQEEGGLGILEVLPEYRKQGIGYALEAYLIDLQLTQGLTPFCHVEEKNAASLALQRKLGMTISPPCICWFFSEQWA